MDSSIRALSNNHFHFLTTVESAICHVILRFPKWFVRQVGVIVVMAVHFQGLCTLITSSAIEPQSHYELPRWAKFPISSLHISLPHKHNLTWILPSSGLLCGVRWFTTDVSGPPIGPIFKGQASCTASPLTTGPTCSPETSVLNNLTPRNYLEKLKTHFNRGGSLRSTHHPTCATRMCRMLLLVQVAAPKEK